MVFTFFILDHKFFFGKIWPKKFFKYLTKNIIFGQNWPKKSRLSVYAEILYLD